MDLRRKWQRLSSGEVDADEVVRDTEESLFAALTESDTGFEALQDTGLDGATRRGRGRAKVGVGAVVLALLWFVATRRRS